MTNIAPFGRYRAFDNNGNPLSGGLLYTYEAGTTTPKATYTTQVGDVANANPVVLDSAGYADVWLGDGGYKFILKTSADVTLWTVDNIGGDSSTAYGAEVNTITTNTTITSVYQNSVNLVSGTVTLTLLPAADAGEGFYFVVKNTGSNTVTIDPDGSETIDGGSSTTIAAGATATIICGGTAWFTLFKTGTAGNYDIGTSGATVPLLNGNNTYSGASTFSGTSTFTANTFFRNTGSTVQRDSERLDAYTNGSLIDRTRAIGENGSSVIAQVSVFEDVLNNQGKLRCETIYGGTLGTAWEATAGVMIGSPTGGAPTTRGHLNAVQYRVNNVAQPRIVGGAVATSVAGVLVVGEQTLGTLARTGAGVFTWTFTTAEPNTNYILTMSTTRKAGQMVSDFAIREGTKATTGFTIEIGSTGGIVPQDPDGLEFVIWRLS